MKDGTDAPPIKGPSTSAAPSPTRLIRSLSHSLGIAQAPTAQDARNELVKDETTAARPPRRLRRVNRRDAGAPLPKLRRRSAKRRSKLTRKLRIFVSPTISFYLLCLQETSNAYRAFSPAFLLRGVARQPPETARLITNPKMQ